MVIIIEHIFSQNVKFPFEAAIVTSDEFMRKNEPDK